MSKRKILMVGMLLLVAIYFNATTVEALTIKSTPTVVTNQGISQAESVLGSDPWKDRAGRLFSGETTFVLQEELIAQTQGYRSQRWVTLRFSPGYVLVINEATGEILRILQCGNPIRATDGTVIRIQQEEQSQAEISGWQTTVQPQVVYQPQVRPQVVYQPQPQSQGAPVQQSVVVYSQPQQSQPVQPVVEENRGSIWGEVLGTIAYGVASGWSQSQSQYNNNNERDYRRPQRPQQYQNQNYNRPQRPQRYQDQNYHRPPRPYHPPPTRNGGPAPYRPNGPSGGGSNSGGPHSYQPNGPAGSRGN